MTSSNPPPTPSPAPQSTSVHTPVPQNSNATPAPAPTPTPTRVTAVKRPNPFLDSSSIVLSNPPPKIPKPLYHKSSSLTIRDEIEMIQLKMEKYDKEFHTRMVTRIPTSDAVEEHKIRMMELQTRLSTLTGTPPPTPFPTGSLSSSWHQLPSPALNPSTSTSLSPSKPHKTEPSGLRKPGLEGGWIIVQKDDDMMGM